MKRFALGFSFILLVCCMMLPNNVRAAEQVGIKVGGVELSTENAYAKVDSNGAMTFEGASSDDYNVYWDSDTATLILRDAALNLTEMQAIEAKVENLTIALSGKNTISVSKDALQQSSDDYAVINNIGGGIVVKDMDATVPGSLNVTLTLNGSSGFIGRQAALIHSEGDFTNTTTLSLTATAEGDVASSVEGIIIAKTTQGVNDEYVWETTDVIDATFSNEGNLDIDIRTNAEEAIGVKTVGDGFSNTGNLSVNASSTGRQGSYSKNYGIQMLGSSSTLAKNWNNNGSIQLDITAEEADYVQGVMIANTQQNITMVNGQNGLLTMQVSSKSATADPYLTDVSGINLDSNKQIHLTNAGALEIEASGLVNAYGIYIISYNEHADFTNSGHLLIDVETSETGSAYGIGMFLNYIEGEEPHHTNLTFDRNSEVQIDTGNVGNRMAINQQRCYATVAAEGEGENQIFFNNTLMEENGTVFTEYQNAYGAHYYVTSLLDADNMPLVTLHIHPAIQATHITVSPDAVNLTTGDSTTLQAKVEPADTTDTTIIWTTSDASIVTVEANGKVTAVAPGMATITATTSNGLTAMCTVTVRESESDPAPDEPPYSGDYNYPVMVEDTEHGTVTIAKEDRWANGGEKITVTVTPDEAYLVEALVVTDKAGNAIDVTDNGDGTYTFTMPEEAVTITATFAEDPDWTEPVPEPERLPFTDVAENDWFYDSVRWVYEQGLMTGTSATTFEPNTSTTRGMIVAILHRLEGSPVVNYAMTFDDVNDGDWYAEAVRWAASEGIVGGMSADTFAPNAPITREQMASILYRYAEYKGMDVSARASLDRFVDAPSEWAADVVSWAVAEGWLRGVTSDALQPQGETTRAQAAAIFARFLAG